MTAQMTFGVFVPQGWKMELAVDRRRRRPSGPRRSRSPQLAEELGYDSVWVYDHFHNVPRAGPRDGVRVLDDDRRHQPAHRRESGSARWSAARYRNPALLAKITSTIDVISRRPARLGHRRRLVRARVSRPTATTSRRPQDRIAHAARDRRDREAHVDRARDHATRASYFTVDRAQCDPKPLQAAAPADLDRRRRRAADAAGRRPPRRPLELRRQARRVGAQVRGAARATATAVGRDYDEIRKTWSPEVFIRETEAEIVDGRYPQSFWGEPFESWRAGNLVGTPEQVCEKIQTLRRPRLQRLRPVVQRLPRHRDA